MSWIRMPHRLGKAGLRSWNVMSQIFFTGNKLEKMSIEDGNGNNAKLAVPRMAASKSEYTSTVMI